MPDLALIGTNWRATLIRLADEAGKLTSELKKEAAGRRSPIKNQFVVELAEFYEEYTGHKASSYTHRPDNVAEAGSTKARA